MPKKSVVETKKTISHIMQVAEKQLLTLGYDNMSYTTLSKQSGISRTGISHHFPAKMDFIYALDEKMFTQFLSYLELEKSMTEFKESWLQSLACPPFIAFLRLFFQQTVSSRSCEHKEFYVRNGLQRLRSVLEPKFGEQGKKELEWLIGLSLIHMGLTNS